MDFSRPLRSTYAILRPPTQTTAGNPRLGVGDPLATISRETYAVVCFRPTRVCAVQYRNGERRMRVLMVDDDEEYLRLCTLILRDDGHDVVPCQHFDEGRRRLAHEHFDALIADVRLGAYNGLHLITLAAASTVRIAVSAFRDPVISRDAEQAGARFVVKPTDCASVSGLLSRHVHRQRKNTKASKGKATGAS